MTEVPRESYYLGAAGVLPYAFTSLSTVYLSYDISHAQSNMGQGYLFSPETAYQLLHLLEPIQIGYGAVVSRFYKMAFKLEIQLPPDLILLRICRVVTNLIYLVRLYLSLEPSTGASNMLAMGAVRDIVDMPLVY